MSVIAAIQMVSGTDVSANLAVAERLIAEAAGQGAELVVLPESFALMPLQDAEFCHQAEPPGRGPVQDFLSRQAERHGIWLVGGTLALRGDDPSRRRAACLVYDARGEQAGRYDKIHLFDAELPEGDEHYRESEHIAPGERITVVDTPCGRLGLAVCYDLRFPALFRAMLDQGAELIAVPAAFTEQTGRAHWEVLLRARAIENQACVIAADQGGLHANGRRTFGHSMAIDAWGRVLARKAQGSGVVLAEFDRKRQQAVRRNLPCLENRRFSCRLQN